jgi:predicted dehydrogenase
MSNKSTGKQICVVGGGRWGLNHIRTLFDMGNLGGIVESNAQRLGELIKEYPTTSFQSINDALLHGFDGFIVATPAETHYSIGRKIIESNHHVLIEKPWTLSLSDARTLVKLAEQNNVNLMVGHVLLFHPAIRKIKEVVDNGNLGELYYLYSTRLSLGTVRTEENVFWSFAPHDISVLDYIIGKPSLEFSLSGGKYLQSGIDDRVLAQFIYPGNIRAHIFVSWLHPFKEQRLVVVGNKGMISYDDSSKEKSICLYHKSIDFENGIPKKIEEDDEIIDYARSQPLKNELQYFVDNLEKKMLVADGMSGIEVVKVLEKAQEFLR